MDMSPKKHKADSLAHRQSGAIRSKTAAECKERAAPKRSIVAETSDEYEARGGKVIRIASAEVAHVARPARQAFRGRGGLWRLPRHPLPRARPKGDWDGHADRVQVVILVRVPIRTVSGLNAREHWRVRSKRVKGERSAVAWAMSCTEPCALPCVVTLTREGKGTLDTDNLQGAAKAVRDAVADWLGCNDNDPRIEWRYAQTKAKDYAVLIEVSPP